MPRIPRNPGSGKAPVNTPARGAGWGGPRRDLGSREKVLISGQAGERLPNGQFKPTVRGLERAAIEEELKSFYLDIKRDINEPTPNRLVAADKLYERVAGKVAATPSKEDAESFLDLVEAAHKRRLQIQNE